MSAEKREEFPDYVRVRSLAGGVLRLANPWPGYPVSVTNCSKGESVDMKEPRVIEVPTTPGSTYLIVRSGADIEALPVVDFALSERDKTDR